MAEACITVGCRSGAHSFPLLAFLLGAMSNSTPASLLYEEAVDMARKLDLAPPSLPAIHTYMTALGTRQASVSAGLGQDLEAKLSIVMSGRAVSRRGFAGRGFMVGCLSLGPSSSAEMLDDQSTPPRNAHETDARVANVHGPSED